jgi:hypothetical protein
MSRLVVNTGLITALLAAVCFAPQGASAVDVGSAACKREMQVAQQLMLESAAVVDSGMKASGAERCEALARQVDLTERIRESFARCEEPQERTSSVRDADEVLEASLQAYNKWCPSRPGMVRVRMTVVERVTRDKLPKPLAAVHRCTEDGVPMFSTNQRFDLGRLVVLGCPGNANPTAAQMKTRNASADMLRNEQAHVYLTRDRDGDDPRRLTFPIRDADGQETTTDLLLAERVFIGDKPDLISMFWDPAMPGLCRVHAIWRVADAKASLVFWGEAADCSSNKPDFKTVLDRR